VEPKSIVNVLDIPLIGEFQTNYGEDVNQNLVNLLENFACPEDPSTTSIEDATPDLTKVSREQLHNPVIGQFWYNSTRKTMYSFDGTSWNHLSNRGVYAANWGRIAHGETIPKPVAQNGKVFEYDECIWSVSPTFMQGSIDTFNCNSDADAKVTATYRFTGTEEINHGIANYLIIGLDDVNSTTPWRPKPIEVSPTPTPTPTPSPTVTATVTPSVTATVTPSVTATVTPSVTGTVTPTPTSSVTPTPTPIPSNTPTPSTVPLAYCYKIAQLCNGFNPGEGDVNAWRPMWKDNTSGNSATGTCANAGAWNHSTFGLIYWSHPVMYTKPAARLTLEVRDNRGNSTGNIELVFFDPGSSSSESYFSRPVTKTVSIGGVNHDITVNITWNKRAGNRNAADGTITSVVVLPGGGLC
jgi:hypothetical protein